MTRVYGPHIFHIDEEQVWNCRVKILSRGAVYSLP